MAERMEGGRRTVWDFVVFRERDCVNAMGVLRPPLDVSHPFDVAAPLDVTLWR